MRATVNVVGVVFVVCVLFFGYFALAMNIDPVNKFAWGENIGWINFGSAEGDVDVSTTGMDGYAWGENIGWISLTCANTSSCAAVDYGVTISGSSVAGYAWGENIGWISFSCSNTSSCGSGLGQVDYGVSIDTVTGDFSGYAWSENVGWIVFNCATTSSCGTVAYKVSTTFALATPTPVTPTPSGGGGTGTGNIPSATPSALPGPTPSPFPTPAGSPPVVTPSESPQPSVPPVIIGLTNQIGDALDFTSHFLFGNHCRGLLGLGACGSTALTTVAVVIALLAGLIQGELLAAASLLLALFWHRRKTPIWGVVYESGTKWPISFATVTLFDETGNVLETRYSDRDGRFGFQISPTMLIEKQVRAHIIAFKPGFSFPTALNLPVNDFLVYKNTYRGGELVFRPDTVPNICIPMDAYGPDRMSLSGFGHGLVGRFGDQLLHLAFFLGLVCVPLFIWSAGTDTSILIGVMFVLANALRLAVLYRPYGITRNALTGKPMPYSLIIVSMGDASRDLFAVSDEHGRYILRVLDDHEYFISLHTPSSVRPERVRSLTLRIPKRFMRHAWILEELIV